eukprot:CAMPEP_0113301892 /NCGR_PEP_ID=MMETSP0010_2-20120614/2926_1 /TAXON_ID=216773 ORGANISM="Corethron hystrix, Strain 308" /NCGR_SAMPLE_ID=MMETSP0010_2 /ASSEMBLY_ACC=CAM_ASM_000155 /LENGTH=151 /DNA_ID=CAMNT_0000155579 /DNA_START=199 /DNA_END=651 /DNA_ORIENTATION=- /assembly_acc=CAM_ASM_000155
MTTPKGSKLLKYVEHRIRVTLNDGRTLLGTFLAFDRHLNLVLSDTVEYRSVRSSMQSIVEDREERRTLGLIILRGENVVSVTVEGPPPGSAGGRVAASGPGMARGIGRGAGAPPVVPVGRGAPVGLGSGPVHGVGGGIGMSPGMVPQTVGG